jgi:hypothetical protein
MKKFKIIRLFSLLVILILVFCVIHAHQSKKSKEIYAWEVQLPSETEAGNILNVYGPDNCTYSNDSDYMTVMASKHRARSDRSLYYWIRFSVRPNIEGIWTGFQNVVINCEGSCETHDGYYCGLPYPYNTFGPPFCIESFLNDVKHPHAGYDHILMSFYIFEDLEAMALGTTLFLHGRSWGSFYLWEFDCYDLDNQTPVPYYHRIIGKMPSVHPGNGGWCDFYVERRDEVTWIFRYSNTNISISESYCEKELTTTGKKGKGNSYYIETSHEPLEGTVPNFALEFTLKKKTS